MNSRPWLLLFTKLIDKIYEKDPVKNNLSDEKWTNFIGKVLDGVGEKMDCYVIRRRPENKDDSGEYLNIDAMFIDKGAYEFKAENAEPLVLPEVAVELENSYTHDKIAYCLWKTMCIRTPLKVLICYQSNEENVTRLKFHLEKVLL
ncbi:MAG TPA: hypothetical protein PKV48_01205, partial [Thermodesulfobacteriota bacterium]|nr:hypothetical protein [Thermodesulfobacteriota bacterium]